MTINYTDKNLLSIDPVKERLRVVKFLQKTFKNQRKNSAVIGLSGGIDSAVSLYLLKEILAPTNIFTAHLYYFEPSSSQIEKLLKQTDIPAANISIISIKNQVDSIIKQNQIPPSDKIRIGNITARLRMIMLFDLAKKTGSLVCGTENRSENLLGYFTRFGDQASDIEPISHLFKSQIYQLAGHLKIPPEIISQKPTAGLWPGQTDENEFGFTYDEADIVLHLHFDKKLPTSQIEKKGFKNTVKILNLVQKNAFKHLVPYHL